MCRLHSLVSRFQIKNLFIQCFNSGPAVAQYRTIKITVAILFKNKTLNQCCFNVGLVARIVIQH